MACSGASIVAIAALPLRGAKAMIAQQPLRDLDQIRIFLSGLGPTAFLDMPWIPIFLTALFAFHPAIGLVSILGAATIIALTVAPEGHVIFRHHDLKALRLVCSKLRWEVIEEKSFPQNLEDIRTYLSGSE